ncbi:MAG: toprim domain-containing protein [Candidatus Methanofastidiosia archaeon]
MNGTSMGTDIRIIVEGLNDVKKICDALNTSSFGRDFSASVTSIIPTTDIKIAKNAAYGADIVIIATDADSTSSHLATQMTEELEKVSRIVERVRLPAGQNVEFSDSVLLREAIEKTIVRAGLKALKMLPANFQKTDQFSEEKLVEDSVKEKNATSFSDEEVLIIERNQLELENAEYLARIKELETRAAKLAMDSFQRFDISQLWENIFNEHVPDLEEMALAASRLSNEIYFSGNYLFAPTLEKAEGFLREFKENFV